MKLRSCVWYLQREKTIRFEFYVFVYSEVSAVFFKGIYSTIYTKAWDIANSDCLGWKSNAHFRTIPSSEDFVRTMFIKSPARRENLNFFLHCRAHYISSFNQETRFSTEKIGAYQHIASCIIYLNTLKILRSKRDVWSHFLLLASVMSMMNEPLTEWKVSVF